MLNLHSTVNGSLQNPVHQGCNSASKWIEIAMQKWDNMHHGHVTMHHWELDHYYGMWCNCIVYSVKPLSINNLVLHTPVRHHPPGLPAPASLVNDAINEQNHHFSSFRFDPKFAVYWHQRTFNPFARVKQRAADNGALVLSSNIHSSANIMQNSVNVAIYPKDYVCGNRLSYYS